MYFNFPPLNIRRAVHKFVKANPAAYSSFLKAKRPVPRLAYPFLRLIFTVFSLLSMKTINHPGLQLKEKLKAADIKAKFLAAKIGVANSQFVDILNGKRRLTPRVAIGLESELGIRALDLVRLQAEYDLAAEKMLEMTEMVEVAKAGRARAF